MGHYWIDLSRAWLLHGDQRRALDSLQQARRIAPQLTRYHPQVHETVHTLAIHDVCVIASPAGYRFIDADTLATTTGHTVRHRYKEPDAPDVLPPADAMVVAPMQTSHLCIDCVL